jgi:hypothetical protein
VGPKEELAPMRSSRLAAPALRRALALAALMALAAAPLAAYTVYLKDGSTVTAKFKYELRNGKAIITLPNGTQTFVDASQIDVARTDAANHGKDYGATEIGTTRVVPGTEPPPPVNKSLKDLIAAHPPSARQLPSARRKPEVPPGQTVRSKAGYLDLSTLPRAPYPRAEVTAELQQFFRSQGIDAVEVWNGSQPDRILVELTTSSEASVFQSLTAGAGALLRLRERFPQTVEAVELLMKTPSREKAGQFVLTPDVAAALAAKKLDAPAFFVANVQF